ncbi:glutamine-hydrolyzing GMP synthase [Candidatus Uhrbacteria bacterium]|nr:glutamine-hydrolyzing GMP synthase [Candidatus Uhrbacteria bacterium]
MDRQDTILIIDFGGQYCHLISRRIRDFGVATEIVPADISFQELAEKKYIRGIILSGGAMSVFDKNAPTLDPRILLLSVHFLGICYGHQLLAHLQRGRVQQGKSGEYGLTPLRVINRNGLLKRLNKTESVWMNHRDVVTKLPSSFLVLAATKHSHIAAYASKDKKFFGVQFHPEVTHTQKGDQILKNFVLDIARCKPTRSSLSLVDSIVAEASDSIGNRKTIIALSGGVDSSVAATLVSRAIGRRLTAIYVDTGLMRHKETEEIKKTFQKIPLRLKVVDAKKQFFSALKGVTEPEKKRKIIGKLFIDIFTKEAKQEKADVLVQGTIYSDRIESGITKHSSVIKSHHNVGGLPKNLGLELYEPLRDLYKDEVRALARTLALPPPILTRQVFPGPGLAIRIIGEVTPERTDIVRQASRIIEEELRKTKHWDAIWMSFAVLLPIKSVGIQGDERSYKYPVVVRIVESRDAMTAQFLKLPFEILEQISTRITNEVREVNRVVYDITHKPPATMEWE